MCENPSGARPPPLPPLSTLMIYTTGLLCKLLTSCLFYLQNLKQFFSQIIFPTAWVSSMLNAMLKPNNNLVFVATHTIISILVCFKSSSLRVLNLWVLPFFPVDKYCAFLCELLQFCYRKKLKK